MYDADQSQKADLIRYLLLTVHGGVYTDTDTQLLKAPSRWGRGADLWKGGKGWMSESNMARLETFSGAPDEERDREVERLIGRAKVIVGIEADVGGREDWAQWWPRPVCTMPSVRGLSTNRYSFKSYNGLWQRDHTTLS